MRVLLCTLNSKYIHTNLAIRLLYHLNREHEGLEWKEFTIKEDRDEIAGHCSRFNLVAFSCYIWNITPTLEVCRLIKRINPDVKILLGGPEVSYEYDSVIARPEVDYIIAGEGETAFAEFLRSFREPENVPGLVMKTPAGIRANAAAPAFDLRLLDNIMPYSQDDPPCWFTVCKPISNLNNPGGTFS